MVKKILILMTAVISLIACTPQASQPAPTPAPSVKTPGPVEPVKVVEPVETRYVDCEDVDMPVKPCVTFDEDEWRVVTRYEPYTFIRINQCSHEDYPNNMPCVWKKQDQQGKWIVLTKP